MILAVDVDYQDDCATVAGVAFESWLDEAASSTFVSQLTDVGEYEPGRFYRRELPCIQRLVCEHKLTPACFVVDGFVYLDGVAKAGLGKHLYDSLETKVPVVGVAKRPFKGIPKDFELYRGKSRRPLYITSVGMDSEEAMQLIRSMHGRHRIPSLLRQADCLCRQGSTAANGRLGAAPGRGRLAES